MPSSIEELLEIGRLPASDNADIAKVKKLESALKGIKCPISDDEARALVRLFGPDDCFGLAWTLLHIIETAPGWPLDEALIGDNEWIERLRVRSGNRSRP